MAVLTDTRQDIADVLAGGAPVHTFVPDRIIAPAVLVVPGSPYLAQEAQPFGSLTARFDVWIVTGAGTNETVTTTLDAAIEARADALSAAGFGVEEIGQPFLYTVQGAQLLTVIITVTTTVTLTK